MLYKSKGMFMGEPIFKLGNQVLLVQFVSVSTTSLSFDGDRR